MTKKLTIKSILILILFFTRTVNAQYPELVKDIAAFPNSSSPAKFAVLGNQLLFSARTGNFGSGDRELFTSDSSAAGTQLFLDIVPGSGSSDPQFLVNHYGKVYFAVADNSFGPLVYRPWVTDGTIAGTYPLLPTPSSFGGSLAYGTFDFKPEDIFLACNGSVYFVALEDGGNYRRMLYKTDGSINGTTVVLNPNTGVPGPEAGLMALNDSIFFIGSISGSGSELYKTDGTPGNYSLVKSNLTYTPFNSFAVYDNKLFFYATVPNSPSFYEPWVSDGSDAGTYQLADINPVPFNESFANSFTRVNGKLLFIAKPSNDTAAIYCVDSLNATLSPVYVKSIFEGSIPAYNSKWLSLNPGGSAAYFRGRDLINGDELWITDGTTAGTNMLKDIMPGTNGSAAHTFVNYCGETYFTASNPNTFAAQSLYKTNGTANGTVLLPGTIVDPSQGTGITDKIVFKNSLFFSGQYDVNTGLELYKYTAACATGVDHEPVTADVRLYPNPSSGNIAIEVGAGYAISSLLIYSADGQLVYGDLAPEPVNSIISLQLSTGLYMVELITDDGVVFEKLIVR